jgi:hypothetical protein
MKTKANSIRLLVLTGLFFVFGFTAKAENSENVRLVMLQNKKVLLEANNLQNQPLSIEISNSITNDMVYSAVIKNNALYKKYYNLSSLPEGNYTFTIKLDNEVFVKEIQLNALPLLLSETSYYEPVFLDENNSLVVNFINPDKENIIVSFKRDYDSFFKDEPGNLHSFSRKYNLKKLEPGEYQVELLSGDKQYIHYVNVK